MSKEVPNFLPNSWFKELEKEHKKNKNQLPSIDNEIWNMYGSQNVHKLRRVAGAYISKRLTNTKNIPLHPEFLNKGKPVHHSDDPPDNSVRPSSVPNTPMPKFVKKIFRGEEKSSQTPTTEEKRPRSNSTPPRKKKKWKSRRQREREKISQHSATYGDEWGLPYKGGKLRSKKRTKKKRGRKSPKRTKKRKKKGYVRKSHKKYKKCTKFFTKRHKITQKKALKMCKMMFG